MSQEVLDGLGTCAECHGHLCISGSMVACERCGHEVPDHPILSEAPGPFAQPHKTITLTSEDNEAARNDFVAILRREVAELKQRVKELEDVILDPVGMHAEPEQPKRKGK